MILTGAEIAAARTDGRLTIEPFEAGRCSPNAYDFRLHPQLRVIDGKLDAARAHRARTVEIGERGYILTPGVLYLGLTYERTGSARYAQMIHGDHSLGSLGVWVHVSAPLGHQGHAIRWTLEIRATTRVRVHRLMTFGKIVFLETEGDAWNYTVGDPKYAVDRIETSRLHEEAAAWTR